MAVEHNDSLLYTAGAVSGACGGISSILRSSMTARQVFSTMIAALFLGSMTGPIVMYFRPEFPAIQAGACGFITGFLAMFLVPAGMKFGEQFSAKIFSVIGKRLGLEEEKEQEAKKEPEDKK